MVLWGHIKLCQMQERVKSAMHCSYGHFPSAVQKVCKITENQNAEIGILL